jgi:hypothetical protein
MAPNRSIVDTLVERVVFIHSSFLEAVVDLDEQTFHAQPGAKAPSIAFHLWHTARWADAFQKRLGSFAPALDRLVGREQVWNARGLAQAWGLDGTLGIEGTGSGLDDDASSALALPAKEEVVSYAREAFASAEEVLRGVRDDELLLPSADFDDEGGWVVLDHFGWHITHGARHLGMVEALKGVQGVRGTATV